jgi:hypothetical protein
MQRREFIQAMVALGLAPKLLAQQAANPAPPPAAPVPWTLGLNPTLELPHTQTADTIAASDPTFFTALQMNTLTHLSDVLMPPVGNKPGALMAETPAFLDFLIGSSPDARKQLYAGGLDWLNGEAQSKYGVPFASTSAAQADALIRPWLRTWMTDHPPAEPHANFINIAHADIRTATMNSKVWIATLGQESEDWVTSGLYWSPIEPDVYAENFQSVHLRPSIVSNSPASTHMTSSYPQ